jgi:hypothetical protein
VFQAANRLIPADAAVTGLQMGAIIHICRKQNRQTRP